MSSLAATKSDNYYYHPEYRPQHGSINKFHGSHPLGARAKNLHKGVLIIRFEMPFKVICCKCNAVIAKGVRFNAEKKCVGNYFSTNIYEFGMKCCFCDNWFRITTDPKNAAYIPTEGIRPQVVDFDANEAGTVELADASSSEKWDAMGRLEKVSGEVVVPSGDELIQSLLEQRASIGSGDSYFSSNQLLRKRLREQKKVAPRLKPGDLTPTSARDDETDAAAGVTFCHKRTRIQKLIRRAETVNTKGLKLLQPPCPAPRGPQQDQSRSTKNSGGLKR